LPLLPSAAETSFSPSSFSISQPGAVRGIVVETIVRSSEIRSGVTWGSTWLTFSASWKKPWSCCSASAGLEKPFSSFATT
jgi:hypothetical protein